MRKFLILSFTFLVLAGCNSNTNINNTNSNNISNLEIKNEENNIQETETYQNVQIEEKKDAH